MAAACSGPNAQAVMAGSSMPKRVSASLTVSAMPPGTCASITAWQVSQSRPLTALRKPATARSWSPAAKASREGAAFLKKAAALGTVSSAGQGGTTQHPPAARTAARGAGRDRTRDRQPQPGPISRRRAGAHRRPIPEQSVARQRNPGSRKGPARRRRCGGGGTVLIGSGATLERRRRPL